jgi:hypothetical protein
VSEWNLALRCINSIRDFSPRSWLGEWTGQIWDKSAEEANWMKGMDRVILVSIKEYRPISKNSR